MTNLHITTDIVAQAVNIEPSWKAVLVHEFEKPYFRALAHFVKNEYLEDGKGSIQNTHNKIYPNPNDIFRAFDMCPFDKVKVVILGQDPYHGAGQANGLSFAVNPGTEIPPSLKNIFKEIESDLGGTKQSGEEPYKVQRKESVKFDGNLTRWTKQGVLLLNSTLTVRANQPGSHQKKGWEEFTDAVIRELSDKRKYIVFMLWGNYAQNKGTHIDRTKHLVLECAHPSPFSAHSGFFGCRHFSKANKYLRDHGLGEIDWR